MVEVKLQATNLEINDAVRQHIDQKLNQIDRHLPGIISMDVELASEPTRSQKDRIVAQVTIKVGSSILRAEHRAPNTKAAINLATDALDRRIERYKSRAYRSERAKQNVPLRAQEAEEAAAPDSIWEEEADSGDELVRIKRVRLEPMSADEAAFQMQLLGHSFFMFLDRESGLHNVVYLRDDGNYGLIQPIVD